MNRKKLTTLALTAGLTLMPTAALAGTGDATALHVEGVITVSDCHAEDGSANCTSLSLLGSEVEGTSQEGEGSNESALGGGEDPSGNDGGEVWLFRSRSEVDGEGNSESSSEAAYVSFAGVIEVSVLRAQANSNGDAESDAVVVGVGGEEIHVLHAQSEAGEGSSAVAVIGGEGIITDEDTGGQFCPADGSPIGRADIICASGSTAGVIDNGELLDGNITGEVVTVNSRDEEGDDAAASPEPSEEDPSAAGAPPADNTPLARTGMSLLGLLIAGIGSTGLGELSRRRGDVDA